MREICKLGNTYAFVVNERLYDQLGRLLKDDLRLMQTQTVITGQTTVVVKLKLEHIMTAILSKGIQLYSWSTRSYEYPYSGYGFCINVDEQLQTLVSQCLH
jgi:hypothetical protein